MSVNISQIPNSFLFPISGYNALLRPSDKNLILAQMRQFLPNLVLGSIDMETRSKERGFKILKCISNLGKRGDRFSVINGKVSSK